MCFTPVALQRKKAIKFCNESVCASLALAGELFYSNHYYASLLFDFEGNAFAALAVLHHSAVSLFCVHWLARIYITVRWIEMHYLGIASQEQFIQVSQLCGYPHQQSKVSHFLYKIN
jgi:hypothetical protein